MQVYGCFMSAILNGVPRIRFGIAVLYDDFLSQFHSKKCVQMADTWIDAGYSSAGSDLSEIDFREDVAISRSFPGFPGPEDWLDLSDHSVRSTPPVLETLGGPWWDTSSEEDAESDAGGPSASFAPYVMKVDLLGALLELGMLLKKYCPEG